MTLASSLNFLSSVTSLHVIMQLASDPIKECSYFPYLLGSCIKFLCTIFHIGISVVIFLFIYFFTQKGYRPRATKIIIKKVH